jgi:hypothetical protein
VPKKIPISFFSSIQNEISPSARKKINLHPKLFYSAIHSTKLLYISYSYLYTKYCHSFCIKWHLLIIENFQLHKIGAPYPKVILPPSRVPGILHLLSPSTTAFHFHYTLASDNAINNALCIDFCFLMFHAQNHKLSIPFCCLLGLKDLIEKTCQCIWVFENVKFVYICVQRENLVPGIYAYYDIQIIHFRGCQCWKSWWWWCIGALLSAYSKWVREKEISSNIWNIALSEVPLVAS